MKRGWKVPLQQFLGDLQHYFRPGQQQIKYRLGEPAMGIMIPQISYKVIAASRARQCLVARNLPECVIAKAPKGLLWMQGYIRFAEIAKQFLKLPLNFSIANEPRLTTMNAPQRQQEEKGFVRCAPSMASPDVDFSNSFGQLVSRHR